MQRVSLVSRPGLFALIQRSDKPQARKFQRWVNHDVLPSIMDHGGYLAGFGEVRGPGDPEPWFVAKSSPSGGRMYHPTWMRHSTSRRRGLPTTCTACVLMRG
jgi:prophage antirepressor-like protein